VVVNLSSLPRWEQIAVAMAVVLFVSGFAWIITRVLVSMLQPAGNRRWSPAAEGFIKLNIVGVWLVVAMIVIVLAWTVL
jgi:hypothetical protein